MNKKREIYRSNRLYLTWVYPTVFFGFLVILSISCNKDTITSKVPVIETNTVSLLEETTATCGGNISSNGGAAIREKGVCWSTQLNPEITTDSRTFDGKGTGEFESSITDLLPNTTYHVRAYATNEAGTAYGKDMSFNTTPSLMTSEVTSITSDSAVSGGDIIDGMVLIIERGVCWSKNHTPTISDSRKTSDSTGTGSFICSIKNLTQFTTYYLRAYAKNPAGISYGNEVSFTTIAKAPSVSTNYVTNITSTEATCGGYSNTDVRAPIIVQGVCWDTAPGPTVELDTKSINGNTKGLYQSTIFGLKPETKYYVRAYATNSGGTGYGYERTFTTTSTPATLTTIAVSSITESTANSGGNITSEGASAVTARGICWSKSPNPTIYNYKTNNGTGTGTFASSMTGLSSATTYYVRAYATNYGGTVYGNEFSFTTNAQIPTITTSLITSTTTISANSGGYISSDGGAAVTSRGICWSTTSNPTIDLSSKTSDGSGTGSFSSSITALTSNTLYYVRAYATNSAGTAYGEELLLKTYTGTVSDIDGNTYNTVTIGTQIWIVENLKVTKYNDGATIPNVTDNSEWSLTVSPAYCWYSNSSGYKETYGALYNWYTIDPVSNGGKNICPTGWHLPTEAEYTTLANYLGGNSYAGGKMKEYGHTNWNSPNSGANNMSGFKGVPGGYRFTTGLFYSRREESNYWMDLTYTYFMRLYYYNSGLTKTGSTASLKNRGFSIRCLKD